jgi:catechol 2,3-dioxygenase-like lactoylglutathione lyase family enzyme
MDIECLHHVALPCSDLERSRRFYQKILGLAEIPRPARGRGLVSGWRSLGIAFGCW